MECKATGEKAMLRRALPETAAEIPVDCEITLPDYCPDIGRMLRCRALPSLTRCEAAGGSVKLEGTVRLRCLYTDGRDKYLRCCEHELPFETAVKFDKLPEGAAAAASADLGVAYINCRASGQRRIDIHGALTARVRAEVLEEADLLTAADGAGVITHSTAVSFSEYRAHKRSEFRISESLELAQGKPSVGTIIRDDAFVIMHECKPIANKLIVKGEALLFIAYCAEGGAVDHMEYSLPFSQFIDIGGVDDECDIDAELRVVSVETGVRTDADGECRRIAAEITLAADAAAYSERELSVVTDAYSVEYELELDRRRESLERLAARADGRCSATCRLESSGEIERVLDCWCEPAELSARCDGSRVTAAGKGTGCAIVRLTDGETEYLEAPLSLESETVLPEKCGRGRSRAAAAVRACGCSISAANRLELKADIDTTATLREDAQITRVCAITPDESRPRRAGERPAAVLYFGEEGEELWSIARENGASAEDIAAENDIEGERLEHDELLLITIK